MASHVEVQSRYHVEFHLQNLFPSNCFVSDEDEIVDLRWINFFVLWCNHHCCDSDQLQLVSRNLNFAQESVNEIDGEEKRLRHELKFKVDLDEPVNQNCPHPLSDIILLLHVAESGWTDIFRIDHILKNFSSVISDHLRVFDSFLVNLANSRLNVVWECFSMKSVD